MVVVVVVVAPRGASSRTASEARPPPRPLLLLLMPQGPLLPPLLPLVVLEKNSSSATELWRFDAIPAGFRMCVLALVLVLVLGRRGGKDRVTNRSMDTKAVYSLRQQLPWGRKYKTATHGLLLQHPWSFWGFTQHHL